jgi:hypothetical protein
MIAEAKGIVDTLLDAPHKKKQVEERRRNSPP